jgi:hypothetical protein
LRVWRPPYRSIIGATATAVVLIAWMSTAFAEPIDPDCFEWCGLGRIIATAGISLVTIGWLFVFNLVAWWAGTTGHALPMASAALAGLFAVVTVALVFGPWISDSTTYTFLELLLLTGVAVQVPAARRIASWVRPSITGGLLLAGLVVAVLIAGFAYVALGTHFIYSAGPQVLYLAHLVSGALMSVLAGLAATRVDRERLALLVIAGGSALYVITAAYSYLVPGSLGQVPVLALLLVGTGWVWLAARWALASVSPPMPTTEEHSPL